MKRYYSFFKKAKICLGIKIVKINKLSEKQATA